MLAINEDQIPIEIGNGLSQIIRQQGEIAMSTGTRNDDRCGSPSRGRERASHEFFSCLT